MGSLLGLAAFLGIFLNAPLSDTIASSGAQNSLDNVVLEQKSDISSSGPEYSEITTTGDNAILAESAPITFVGIGKVKITAYSSTPDQTDDSPFIMANGKHVHDGAVATNFLPLGTHVRIPELYGDKVFTVEDRMAKRFSDRMDIWMETRAEAKSFGLKHATIEIAQR